MRVRLMNGDLHVRRPDGSFVGSTGIDRNVRCASQHLCRGTLTNVILNYTAHNVRDPQTGQRRWITRCTGFSAGSTSKSRGRRGRAESSRTERQAGPAGDGVEPDRKVM